MILPFSTQINGKPTYFVEKIWKGLLNKHANLIGYNNYRTEASINGVIDQWDYSKNVNPKLHTIREDKNDRWKAGTKIDFFINCRQKNMFRFAPVLPVVSVQKVEIKWFDLFGKKMVRVFIDNQNFACVKFDSELIVTGKILLFAQNDGFDSVEDFFAYFNEDFKGKIIHWTDLKY